MIKTRWTSASLLIFARNVEKQMSQNPTQLLRDDRPVGYMSCFALTPIPFAVARSAAQFCERLSARSCEKISTSIMCPTYVVRVVVVVASLVKKKKKWIMSKGAFRLRKTARGNKEMMKDRSELRKKT
jgi:hypothetical protein